MIDALVWLCAGVVLIAIEIAIPHFVLCFFGAGALVTAGVAALFPNLGDPWQILIFAVLSFSMLFSLRRVFPKLLRHAKVSDGTPHEEDEDAGRTAEVLDDIAAGSPGRIQFHGSPWNAETEDGTPRKKGDRVQIVRRKNLTYFVK